MTTPLAESKAKLASLKKTRDKAAAEVSSYEARKDVLTEQLTEQVGRLKDEFGCNTITEAHLKAAAMQAELDQKLAAIQEKIA
jgi:chromosome segregation ATPase